MPGISGGYSFRGEQLPVGWFGERFGDAIEADVGCTKRFSVIRMAMARLLFSSSRHSVSISLCSKSSRAAKGPELIVCNSSDIKFSKSRISRAYIKLLRIPKGVEKTVSLARIGNCEIRMLEASQIGCNAAPFASIPVHAWNPTSRRQLGNPCRPFFQSKEPSMKKIVLVAFAILAVSTSSALAKKATKPKATAAAATTTGAAPPLMFGQVSAADRELYKRNLRDSGMKK